MTKVRGGANSLVMLCVRAAYQVFSQPVFMAAERWIEKRPWARDTRTFFITTRLTVRSAVHQTGPSAHGYLCHSMLSAN